MSAYASPRGRLGQTRKRRAGKIRTRQMADRLWLRLLPVAYGRSSPNGLGRQVPPVRRDVFDTSEAQAVVRLDEDHVLASFSGRPLPNQDFWL
jgi:hypothetical protein